MSPPEAIERVLRENLASAHKAFRSARKEFTQALKEYTEFVLDGIIPERLNHDRKALHNGQ